MTGALTWTSVILAPLLAILVAAFGRDRAYAWLWVCCLPALAAVIWPLPALKIDFLWPGAEWSAPDSLTRAWLGTTAFLWACATAFAAGSLRSSPHRQRFWLFWLVALAGNLLLIVARDALSFYTGFTVLSLAAYGLVVHFGSPRSRRAGRLYLQMAVTGEFLVFAGLVCRAGNADASLSFEQWQNTPLDGLTLGLLILGFGIKIGFWPLHIWLPLAHPAAPAPASAVLSGAMLKAGVLGLWHFLPPADPLLQEWAGPLFGLGLISVFYGVLAGLVSVQAKVALAYSSISQMGYFLMILALGWSHSERLVEVALLLTVFTVHHGVAKGSLFLAAEMVGDRRFVCGRRRWVYWLILAVPALALCGLPLTSGAAAKNLLKDLMTGSSFYGWSLTVALTSTGTTVLLARALLLLWQKNQKEQRAASRLSLLSWLLLSLAPLGVPWLWSPMREPLLHGLALDTAASLAWPVLLGAILAIIPLWRGWRLPNWLKVWRQPALRLSLQLARLIQRPPLPSLQPSLPLNQCRRGERRWNRFWQSGRLATSAWLIALLLMLSWLWQMTL